MNILLFCFLSYVTIGICLGYPILRFINTDRIKDNKTPVTNNMKIGSIITGVLWPILMIGIMCHILNDMMENPEDE